jgi:hypothetical protein
MIGTINISMKFQFYIVDFNRRFVINKAHRFVANCHEIKPLGIYSLQGFFNFIGNKKKGIDHKFPAGAGLHSCACSFYFRLIPAPV